MPNDKESEQALLAALMLEKNIYKQIDLSIDDFYEKSHQRLYQIITEICEEGLEADYVSVNAKLKSHGWQKEIQPEYLLGLCKDIPGAVTTQWKNYVSIIKKKSAGRRLVDFAKRLEVASRNGKGDTTALVDEAIRQLSEIKEKAEGKSLSIQEKVRAWISVTTGNFTVTDINRELIAVTERNKSAVRMAVKRLCDANYIVPCGEKHGCYRMIERDAPTINFKGVRLADPFKIKWPFELEKYVHVFAGNVILVAGSRNAGKTAFLLNVVRTNMQHHKIEYFSSEMDEDEFFIRLSAFEDIDIKEWSFSARKRSGGFEDVIVPDAINIIDYLDISDDFYKVGGQIKEIWSRLKKGIAIIGLQKPKGRDTGLGGEMSLDKPRLALAIDSGKIKIVKGKIWASHINPDGLEWTYKLVNGCKYIETGGSVYNLDRGETAAHWND